MILVDIFMNLHAFYSSYHYFLFCLQPEGLPIASLLMHFLLLLLLIFKTHHLFVLSMVCAIAILYIWQIFNHCNDILIFLSLCQLIDFISSSNSDLRSAFKL